MFYGARVDARVRDNVESVTPALLLCVCWARVEARVRENVQSVTE